MTAGDFALSIAQQCSTFRELPSNLVDAIAKLERYERLLFDWSLKLMLALKSIEYHCFGMQNHEPEELRFLPLSEGEFQGETG